MNPLLLHTLRLSYINTSQTGSGLPSLSCGGCSAVLKANRTQKVNWHLCSYQAKVHIWSDQDLDQQPSDFQPVSSQTELLLPEACPLEDL